MEDISKDPKIVRDKNNKLVTYNEMRMRLVTDISSAKLNDSGKKLF